MDATRGGPDQEAVTGEVAAEADMDIAIEDIHVVEAEVGRDIDMVNIIDLLLSQVQQLRR